MTVYFEWEKMPFVRGQSGVHVPVVIVGGGPVGLAMAQALSRKGIRSIVLETRDQISDGSRAIVLTRRTMQIFDELGVGDAVLEKALCWDFNAVHFGTRLIYQTRLPQPACEKHRSTNLQQCWVEQIFLDRLKADGLAEVRWRTELIDAKQAGNLVELTVKGPDDVEYRLTADYLIAADGGRGSTRKFFDLSYEGERFEQRFVITDFEVKSNLEHGRRVWFSPPYALGTTVLQHCGPFDMWRLDYQLRAEDDAEKEVSPERVAKRLAAHLQMIGETAPYEIIWTSIYRANALSLPTYQRDRVFFIGDAAHQIPIFGGRGINNGFMDVMNLAWKLGYVMEGAANESLLASYTEERRTSILETIEDLGKVTVYMTTPSPAVALMRDATLSLSLTEPFVHTLFDPFRVPPYTSLAITTTASAKAGDLGFDSGPALGQVTPDMPISVAAGGGALTRLLNYSQGKFLCLAWGGTPESDEMTEQVFTSLKQAKLPVQCVAMNASRPPAGSIAATSAAATGIFDAGAGTVYLLRPDHHVIGRWKHGDAASVSEAVSHSLGRQFHNQLAEA